MTRFELATSSLESNNAGELETAEVVSLSTDAERRQVDDAAVCTSVCTSEPETGDAGRLRELAEVIRGLTPNERAALRQLLVD